jgi:hypothetical protein
MKRYIFTKCRESIPTIVNNKIKDQKAGGIKFEYSVQAADNIHIRIGKRDIYIPYWKYKPMILVFVKPLKSQCIVERCGLASNFKGKKDDLYTNLWLILQSKSHRLECFEDIINIKKDYKAFRIKTICTKKEHHEMIKHLNKSENHFSVPATQIFF